MADRVIRSYVEGLRDRSLPNGVMDRARLRVVGQDPLPAGATADERVVKLTGNVALENWDIGSRGIVVYGKVRLFNVLSQNVAGQKAGGPLYGIEVYPDGEVEWAEQVEISGTFGKKESPPAVLNCRSEGSGAGYRAGRVRMVRRSRFEGFGVDHFKLHGVPGGTEVIEENYFGPQWGLNGTKPHADTFTTVAAMGTLVIRRNLVDWNDKGNPIGVNNYFRLVRNNNTDTPFQNVLITENVCYHGPFKSFPMQAADGGRPNYDGPIEIVGNWLGANARGRYFHPSTNGLVARWAGNSDLVTGRDIPAPRGARTI